jgi:glutamate dehydrogenase (NAD(P)+)
VAVCVEEAIQYLGWSIEAPKVVIQGCGNVGQAAGRFLARKGFRIVAVSDVQGGTYHPEGLDLQALLRHKEEAGMVHTFPGGEPITNAELLELPCDVLIPAALENQITSANAERIRARMIAEAANGPVTPVADEVLNERGVFIIPDILCNAGGVMVSYFEWVQGREEYFWSLKEVNERLDKMMVEAFREAMGLKEERGVSPRWTAYILGVGRVAQAVRWRGIYP